MYKNYIKPFPILWIVFFIFFPAHADTQAPDQQASFLFTTHADGTVSINATSTSLQVIFNEIHRKKNIEIKVGEGIGSRVISISEKHIPFYKLLKKITGNNYAIIFNNDKVSALHLLQKDNTTKSPPDFTGRVSINNNHARLFFIPSSNSQIDIVNYISDRHSLLEFLSKNRPNLVLSAQISFDKHINADALRYFVFSNDLTPIAINIGWQDNGAGYHLKKGESIDNALNSAASHHRKFTQQLLEDAHQQTNQINNQNLSTEEINEINNFKTHAEEISYKFNKNGLTIYGLRITGKANRLHQLTSKPAIKLVDPLWAGELENEIQNNYSVSKVAIPIAPQ